LADVKGGAKALGESVTPLLEVLCLALPAMYQLINDASNVYGTTEGQRIAFEPLAAAAAVVDKMLGDGPETPSMVAALERFFGGEFVGGRSAAAEMLAELCYPLMAAFLPSHSVLLAQMLTRLLQQGPIAWEEPLMLLVAYSLQHPQSPAFVDHFHLVVDLCTDSESEAALYCLSSAMQAAARGGDQITSLAMGQGKPFDEIANLQFYKQEGKELELTRAVVAPVAAVLASLKMGER